jgi:hypothetical protein
MKPWPFGPEFRQDVPCSPYYLAPLATATPTQLRLPFAGWRVTRVTLPGFLPLNGLRCTCAVPSLSALGPCLRCLFLLSVSASALDPPAYTSGAGLSYSHANRRMSEALLRT